MAATTAHVSVDEYLNTVYRPDCDFVNGEILERNLGEWDHNTLQMALGSYFFSRRREWNLWIVPEQRIRVRANRYRIPDLCVVLGPEPKEQVLTVPPFLCVELLSPSDRRSRVKERIDDFLEFGVSYVWLIDPQTRRAWVYSPELETEVADGILRAGHLTVPIAELFD